MKYAIDRAWSDRFIPEVRRIVGPLLLEPAPLENDIHEATDLIVLRARDKAIAVRIRRPGYAGRYPGQFTIRSKRDNGTRTELEKIIDGWGHWFFYGHSSHTEDTIAEWILVDLNLFRAALIRDPDLRKIAGGQQRNGDGTHFCWFDAYKFPPNILIASSDPPKPLTPRSRPFLRDPQPLLDLFGGAAA